MISPSTYFPEGSKQKIDRSMVKQQRVRREKRVMEMFISIRQFMLICTGCLLPVTLAYSSSVWISRGLQKSILSWAFIDNSLD